MYITEEFGFWIRIGDDEEFILYSLQSWARVIQKVVKT